MNDSEIAEARRVIADGEHSIDAAWFIDHCDELLAAAVKLNLDELERKARTALTDEPWRVHFCGYPDEVAACGICTGCDDDRRCGRYADIVGDMSGDECHHPMSIADAEHIAAASPPVVLALIAEIRSLRAVSKASTALVAEHKRLYGPPGSDVWLHEQADLAEQIVALVAALEGIER